MAFVYNNKLPFYSWGILNVSGGSTGPIGSAEQTYAAYQLNEAWGGLLVPLPESGAQRLWDGRSGIAGAATIANRAAPATSTPCDAQMPWKSFVREVRRTADDRPLYVFGLTLHGELYAITPVDFRWYRGSSSVVQNQGRRIGRIAHSKIQSPFSSVTPSLRTVINGIAYQLTAVTKDGKAWRIGVNDTTGLTEAEEISLPTGELAAYFISLLSDASGDAASTRLFVLTTQNNKTFVRKSTSATWYCLTGGCVGLDSITITNRQWSLDNLPTFTVSAPPAGGTRAEVEIVWRPTNSNNARPWHVRVRNPGSGYTTNPTVTTTATPTAGASSPAPTITLKVFDKFASSFAAVNSYGVNDSSNGHFLDSDGNLWSVRIPSLTVSTSDDGSTYPATAFADNTVEPAGGVVSWISDASPVNTSSQPLQLSAYVDPSLGGQRFAITKNGELWKQNPAGNWSVFDGGPWAAVAQNYRILCGVKRDGTMWSWGEVRGNIWEHCFGDETPLNTTRAAPVQIAPEAGWVSVFAANGGFIAIRKDAICRDVDQPMEYWPDWYFQQQTT